MSKLPTNIHFNQPVIHAGIGLGKADLVVILLHGRGAKAESMIGIVEALNINRAAYLIPQAAYNRWYLQSAFGPIEANEPDLTSALARINILVKSAEEDGFSKQKIALGGFSQGACLASEYAARSPYPYAGLFILSGALIGPKGLARSDGGDYDGMPVFIGGSNKDPWVDYSLLRDTADFFSKRGAKVQFRSYPDLAHTINQDEIDQVREMLIKTLSAQ
jgi:predicted esterase